MNKVTENYKRTKQKFRNRRIMVVKNSLEGINSRLDQAEERTGRLKDRLFEIVKSEEQKSKTKKRIKRP